MFFRPTQLVKSKGTWHPWNAHFYSDTRHSPVTPDSTLGKVSHIKLPSRHAGWNQMYNQTDNKTPNDPEQYE